MKPSHGIVKVNFDATISSKKMGYGMIAQDSDGFLLGGGGGGGIVEMNLHADWAELKVFGENIIFSKAFKFNDIQFETNSV
ncbi:hypothetical protein Gorai_022319, partial [Gossypium raimondii]|nr:hypothetical protein [Gossypium raimondii]